ncbi:hypothetical protein [Candidatus Mesenet endosymbiont of Agriotes lineatus]|uniref:hypothetical protein n=1 Tax=Candidatus Mesenet endosymbiont of Agriotes lineatus TaxID=3077948 RepID=UPI0030CFCF89
MVKTNLTAIKGETATIKTATDKIASIKDATDEIANIKTKVDEMDTKIKALEGLVGKPDDTHNQNTGIYKAIYDGFTDLIG